MLLDPNSSHESLGENPTNIIKVIQNIGCTTSPDRTKITPEKTGVTIEKMAHGFLTICSSVSNGLFISIVRTHSCIFSEHQH